MDLQKSNPISKSICCRALFVGNGLDRGSSRTGQAAGEAGDLRLLASSFFGARSVEQTRRHRARPKQSRQGQFRRAAEREKQQEPFEASEPREGGGQRRGTQRLRPGLALRQHGACVDLDKPVGEIIFCTSSISKRRRRDQSLLDAVPSMRSAAAY